MHFRFDEELLHLPVHVRICVYLQLVFGNCGVHQGISQGKAYIDMSTVDVETITDVHEASPISTMFSLLCSSCLDHNLPVENVITFCTKHVPKSYSYFLQKIHCMLKHVAEFELFFLSIETIHANVTVTKSHYITIKSEMPNFKDFSFDNISSDEKFVSVMQICHQICVRVVTPA